MAYSVGYAWLGTTRGWNGLEVGLLLRSVVSNSASDYGPPLLCQEVQLALFDAVCPHLPSAPPLDPEPKFAVRLALSSHIIANHLGALEIWLSDVRSEESILLAQQCRAHSQVAQLSGSSPATWERWESRLEACLHVCGGRWSWESVEAWCESLKLGSVSQESAGTRRKAEGTTRNRAAGGAVNTAELTLLRPAGPG
ncbi:hypothetical protein PspLS_10543 [Pyricularia sp. CBS 133598]|nr:hypothetical protein PspLS_10543 [Pyricularia sp. CBS 133598]